MIYPVLKINQNIYNNQMEYTIKIIDTLTEESFEFQSNNTLEVFYNLLVLFLNQYSDGYSQGYEDAMDDMEENEWY